MGLLTQNTKMKKTGSENVRVLNWTIRAGVSCPFAGACNRPGKCYAQSGAYQFGNVRRKHEANFELTKTEGFEQQMRNELMRHYKLATKKGQRLIVRIHDAGDFYSLEYLLKWLGIIRDFEAVTFYCYTKSVPLFKRLPGVLPSNFLVNFSMGGIADRQVDVNADRHVHIFESAEALLQAGYVRNDDTDRLAFDSSVRKIGLVARWKMTPTFSADSGGIGKTKDVVEATFPSASKVPYKVQIVELKCS